MTMTYRAAYLLFEDSQSDLVLTSPEHAGLSDEDLRAEALREATSANLIGESDQQITLAQFKDWLRIGAWAVRK
jgi:hypothetical protein